MDRIDAMRAFVRVAERRSFAQAAHDLGLPRSRVSEAVQQLERRLGTRLLLRTTRQVTPTAEGEAFHRRCLLILAAIDDAEAGAAEAVPEGPLRVDVHGSFARRFLLPGLAGFLDRHPGIRLHLGDGDRLVDLIRDGVDCAIRIGEPASSGLTGRRLGVLEEGTFASPGYLRRHGTPLSLDDLEGHRMIGFVSSATRAVMPFMFRVGDGRVGDGQAGGLRAVPLPAAVTVTSAESNVCLGVHGLGLIQAPRYRLADEIASGALVEVLAAWPPPPLPVHLLHPEGRQPSPRLRAFMDWVVAEASDRLRAQPPGPASPGG